MHSSKRSAYSLVNAHACWVSMLHGGRDGLYPPEASSDGVSWEGALQGRPLRVLYSHVDLHHRAGRVVLSLSRCGVYGCTMTRAPRIARMPMRTQRPGVVEARHEGRTVAEQCDAPSAASSWVPGALLLLLDQSPSLRRTRSMVGHPFAMVLAGGPSISILFLTSERMQGRNRGRRTAMQPHPSSRYLLCTPHILTVCLSCDPRCVT